VYEQLRAPRCYALCAGVLALSSVLLPGPPQSTARFRSRLLPMMFMVVVAAVSWRVAHTIWLQAPGSDKPDLGQHARGLPRAIHTKRDGKAHTPVASGNSSRLVPRLPVFNAAQD